MDNEVLLTQYKMANDEISKHRILIVVYNISFLALSTLIVIFIGIFSKWFFSGPVVFKGHIYTLKMLLVCGMLLTLTWLGYSMRLQMKLKLRYFQARYMERMLGITGYGIYTDERSYFGGNKQIESPDRRELLKYPNNLDGFYAKINPSLWEWFLPAIFFITFFSLFIIIIISY